MATVKLLNSAYNAYDNVNGYHTADDTFTANSLSITLHYFGGLGARNTISVGLQHNQIASSAGLTNYPYTLDCDYNEVQFVKENVGYDECSLYIYPYPTITYSVPHGTAPATQRVQTGGSLSSANLPSFSTSGYIFQGWYYDSSYRYKAYENDTITQTSNFTLYARLSPITDMKTSVKNIVIPEGTVKKIMVGAVLLWSKPANYGWETVWTGSKTVSVTGNTGTISGTEANFASLPEGSGDTPMIRVTYSTTKDFGITNVGSYGVYYYENGVSIGGSSSSTQPASPITINAVITGSDKKILGANPYNSSDSYGCRVWLEKDYDSTNDRIRLSLAAELYSNGTNRAKASLTVTKIEYYKPEPVYRRLEYIQSSGKQAIDTTAKPARNSYMKLIVEDMDSALGGQQMGRGAVQNNQRFAAGYSEGKYFFGFGSSWVTGSAATSGKHTLAIQGPECKVFGNGQGYSIDGTFTSNAATFPSGITWYSVYILGSRGDTSGSIQGTVKCKLYYAELGYTNTSTQAQGYNKKLYPVQRKSDGQLGFYDTVSKTFYYTLVSGSDSGTLSAGPTADEDWDERDVVIS